eukprot:TRINITY_DN12196_c0_g2_i5.p1 TRINITY_DN12196_c0_g2~~TRINITY_DN12196_c0_g2_i5.p1  ORF type:complete len:184 (-),score=38.08 TRINITY_DN12196_c0_g2_i5:909-1460(-)
METRLFGDVDGLLNESQLILLKDLEETFASEAKQTNKAGVPRELIVWFILARKTYNKVYDALHQYRRWAKKIDFASLSWEDLEQVFQDELMIVPSFPFMRCKNGSTLIFLDTHKVDPPTYGGRVMIGALWLVMHFLLARSSALMDGVSNCIQAGGISLSKFYPSQQRCIVNSMQVSSSNQVMW